MITGTQRTVYYGSIMDKAERRERILNKDLLVPGTGQYAPGTVWMFSPYEGCTGEPVDCQCVVITDTCPGFTLFILQGWMAGWLAASSQLTKEIFSCYLVGHWQYARPYIIRGTTTKDLLWLVIPVLTKFNHAVLNDVPAVTQKHSSPCEGQDCMYCSCVVENFEVNMCPPQFCRGSIQETLRMHGGEA